MPLNRKKDKQKNPEEKGKRSDFYRQCKTKRVGFQRQKKKKRKRENKPQTKQKKSEILNQG